MKIQLTDTSRIWRVFGKYPSFLLVPLAAGIFIFSILTFAIVKTGGDTKSFAAAGDNASLTFSWSRPGGYAGFIDSGGKQAFCYGAGNSCSVGASTYWPGSPLIYSVKVNDRYGPVFYGSTTPGAPAVVAKSDGSATVTWPLIGDYGWAAYPTGSTCQTDTSVCDTGNVSGDTSSTITRTTAAKLKYSTSYTIDVCTPNCGTGYKFFSTSQTTPAAPAVPACTLSTGSIVAGQSMSVGSVNGLVGPIQMIGALASPGTPSVNIGSLAVPYSTVTIPLNTTSGLYVVRVAYNGLPYTCKTAGGGDLAVTAAAPACVFSPATVAAGSAIGIVPARFTVNPIPVSLVGSNGIAVPAGSIPNTGGSVTVPDGLAAGVYFVVLGPTGATTTCGGGLTVTAPLPYCGFGLSPVAQGTKWAVAGANFTTVLVPVTLTNTSTSSVFQLGYATRTTIGAWILSTPIPNTVQPGDYVVKMGDTVCRSVNAAKTSDNLTVILPPSCTISSLPVVAGQSLVIKYQGFAAGEGLNIMTSTPTRLLGTSNDSRLMQQSDTVVVPATMPAGSYNFAVITQFPITTTNCAGGPITIIVLTACSADINHNGKVEILDLTKIASANGATYGSPNYVGAYDLNQDGIINTADLWLAGQFFGQTCPNNIIIQSTSPTPTPPSSPTPISSPVVFGPGRTATPQDIMNYINAHTLDTNGKPVIIPVRSDNGVVAGYDFGEVLYGIAGCETGGKWNPSANSGTYFGIFQYDQTTWNTNNVFGYLSDDYFDAYRASDVTINLLQNADFVWSGGFGKWPICGKIWQNYANSNTWHR